MFCTVFWAVLGTVLSASHVSGPVPGFTFCPITQFNSIPFPAWPFLSLSRSACLGRDGNRGRLMELIELNWWRRVQLTTLETYFIYF